MDSYTGVLASYGVAASCTYCHVFCYAALAAILLHFVFLFWNILVSWLLRFPEQERKAIIIMASQKNLPTAATIISYFDPAAVGNLGLITIPCIVFYIMQLFIDSFIANTWSSKYERIAAVEASYKEQLKELEGRHSSSGGAAPGSDGADLIAAVPAGSMPGAQGMSYGTLGRRPSRPVRLNSRGSDEDTGLLQTVELNDVNPLLERH